jgi:Domain of unknown function DUF29
MKLSRLYTADETAWLEQSANLIHEGRYDALDYKHLEEFLWDMAIRDRREVMSRLATLLMHLLKWDYQPRKRSRSWRLTIITQRQELEDALESKTLMNHAHDSLPRAYAKAVARAIAETGLSGDRFPHDCPYALDEVLGSKELETPTENNP